jgi:hypothetical protein
LDGWDDGNLGVQDLDGERNCSSLASSRNRVQDSKDQYTFGNDGDDLRKDLPSITMYMNGNGILNNSDILLKSSTVEDVEDVVTTKATSIGKIGTEEEESPPHILIEKGHASGGGKKGKEVE